MKFRVFFFLSTKLSFGSHDLFDSSFFNFQAEIQITPPPVLLLESR